MASFRKRGPYQWEAQIRRRGFPPQSKTFNTKAEAEAWANMNESEMARGVWVSRGEAESTTLHEALERYELEITPGKKTAAGEKSFLRVWKASAQAKRPLASIRSSELAKIRDLWLREYAPATVLRRFAVLSHVFTIARKEWGMESLSNPVEPVRKPQANDARTRRIADFAPGRHGEDGNEADRQRGASNGELERVVAATESPMLPDIIWIAVETAMRRSEIAGLYKDKVYVDRRVASLPETKNGSARDVPLSTRAASILKARLETEEESDETSEQPDPEDRVFNIRADAITRAFERAVARARKVYEKECKDLRQHPAPDFLRDLRFHDLRHEATSRLAAIFPLHDLAKITGHKDPRMLMRYYHPRAEDLAKRLA